MISKVFRQYGVNGKDVLRNFPELDFDMFFSMGVEFKKICADYQKYGKNPDYSREFKQEKFEEAKQQVDELKLRYYNKAADWIDENIRNPKAEKQEELISLKREEVLELEALREQVSQLMELSVLDKQLSVEPASKLLDIYNDSDSPQVKTLIELELRQRKDSGSEEALQPWLEAFVDQHGREYAADFYLSQLEATLNTEASYFPIDLHKGKDKADYQNEIDDLLRGE